MIRFAKIALTTALLSMPASLLAQTSQPGGPDALPPMKQDRQGMKMRGEEGGNMMGMRMRDVMAKLSTEGRAIMETTMKGQREQMMANGEKLRVVHERILGIISAEKFDASALKKAFADERALSGGAQEKRHDAMVTAMSKLSSSDRKIVGTSMSEMRDRMKMRKNRMQDHMGGPGMAEPPPPQN